MAWTNQTKNTGSYTNITKNKSSSLFWSEATMTWAEATFTWKGGNPAEYINSTKNTGSWTNLGKS